MKLDNNLFRGLLFKHFAIQRGMFFNNSIFKEYGSFYFSEEINDELWNYFIPENAYLVLKEFDNINKIITDKERKGYKVAICIPSFIEDFDTLCNEIVDKKYNYKLDSEETWMVMANDFNCKEVNESYICKVVESDKEFKDYISVFKQSYGGEKTDTAPYGALDRSYIDCINKNKNNPFIKNYILYNNNKPVSCATMNITNGIGGLYGIGTIPTERGKGYGTVINNCIIKSYFKNNSKFLFLQTERGSKVEKLYKKIGYKEVFYVKLFVKDGENNE